MRVKNDHRSEIFQFKQLERRSLKKKSGLQRDPVEALIFFQASSFQLLKLKIHCDDHSSLSSIIAVQNELFHLLTSIIS